MAKEAVVFKGTRDGLCLFIDEEADLETVLAHIEIKLARNRDFYTGAEVKVYSGGREFSEPEREALARLMASYGIHWDREAQGKTQIAAKRPDEALSIRRDDLGAVAVPAELSERAVAAESEPTYYVRRTLRSGQRVRFPGNVVVFGDVNPGAEVIADGDIIVLGTLRGVAHAGAGGDKERSVFGLSLVPMQLRIGDIISRSPDEDVPQRSGPEIARVQEDTIVISEYLP